MNLAILWRLLLVACRLYLGSLRLGACSLWPLIQILGPNFSQLLAMILSSAAMVCSWPGDAWLTSIVYFFIIFYLFLYFFYCIPIFVINSFFISFYYFFHIFILLFNCVFFVALGAWSLRLISSRNFRQLFT